MSFDTGGPTTSVPSAAPDATPEQEPVETPERTDRGVADSPDNGSPVEDGAPGASGSSDSAGARVSTAYSVPSDSPGAVDPAAADASTGPRGVAAGDAGTETVQLSNGLTCSLPASSPLAKLLRSQRTWVGPGAKERLAILRRAKSVAIVGASPNPARSSYFVGTYLLQSSDYRVYFVNPNADEILGHRAYPDLASLPEVPDIVDVFRRASDIPSVMDDAIAVGAPTVWVQLGIWNQDAAEYGERQGLTVVMDRCIKVEHARFHGGLRLLGFDTGVISSRRGAA